jgi:hypothetical protein
MLDWKYRDQVSKNQILPDTRTICFTDTWSQSQEDNHFSVSFNPRASLTLISGASRVRLFDTQTGNLLSTQEVQDKVSTALFSSDQLFVYVVGVCRIHRLHLSTPDVPQLEQDWLSAPAEIVSAHPHLKDDLVILFADGSVQILNSSTRSLRKLKTSFKPSAIAVSSANGSIAVADASNLAVYSPENSMLAEFTEGFSGGLPLGIEFIAESPLTLLVRQKDTIIFFRSSTPKTLTCYHQLKDAITRVIFTSVSVCPGPRPLLAVGSKEAGNRLKLELLDLSATPTPLLRWDVSRLGEITKLAWLPAASGRAFVSIFSTGSSVLWTPAPQSRRDNWQTCVPNLEPCFTNQPHAERETEFDFNMKGDRGVVNRYARSETREWEFGQGLPTEVEEAVQVDDEIVPGEPKYPFLDLTRLVSGRYEETQAVGSDRHFNLEGDTVFFELIE